MKIWFNKVHEAKRVLIESDSPEIRIGRDPTNIIVLQSPLVSKRHAVVTRENGRLKLENVGVNGCLVGEQEVLTDPCAEGVEGERRDGVHGARSLARQDNERQRFSRRTKGITMEYSRRTVLQLSAVTAATTALSMASSSPAAAATKRSGTTKLERSVFAPLVGSTFTIGGVRAKLTAVRDLRSPDAGSNTRFSLLFTSSGSLVPATYDVSHPSLQSFRLYLGPVGRTVGYYEAVIYA